MLHDYKVVLHIVIEVMVVSNFHKNNALVNSIILNHLAIFLTFILNGLMYFKYLCCVSFKTSEKISLINDNDKKGSTTCKLNIDTIY